MEYWFRGHLEFNDQAAAEAAQKQLYEEGYEEEEDNLLRKEDFVWKGKELEIDKRGSMPYSCFGASSEVLAIYAQHATKGEVIALNVEDGVGERYHAADGSIEADHIEELSDDEVKALCKEYGWDED
ncbi:MAG: hypothetical protein ACFCBW_11430 [Candidatus Competibacterales bacterium]